jgi:hypothetical protein
MIDFTLDKVEMYTAFNKLVVSIQFVLFKIRNGLT